MASPVSLKRGGPRALARSGSSLFWSRAWDRSVTCSISKTKCPDQATAAQVHHQTNTITAPVTQHARMKSVLADLQDSMPLLQGRQEKLGEFEME